MSDIVLETRLVGSIKGQFFVPSYQRGYRWTEEVIRLLDDIEENGTNNYCLQPVVVKRNGEAFTIIDGQQRLTTIYLIYKYLNAASNGFFDEPRFSIKYETRTKSEQFLLSLDPNIREDNIDFWFISQAYEAIGHWFEGKGQKSAWTDINTYFDKNVKIIWYEAGDKENVYNLFTRLNIGKIPLTNAELVKAMFLSQSANKDITRERQEEIALQWDSIESKLHDESLWFFLNNVAGGRMQTRIDLILDLIAQTPPKNTDKYHTFFKFSKMKEDHTLTDVWIEISHVFLILKDWYEQDELYHKVGYLIASGFVTLSEIYNRSKNLTKREFIFELDRLIIKSIKFGKPYGELEYGKDNKALQRLLLLFNIESVKKQQRFPFDKYKDQKNGVSWSLEHIHARHSEGLKTQAEWRQWLDFHLEALKAVSVKNDDLLQKTVGVLNSSEIKRQDFENLQFMISERLSADGNMNSDKIGNLALLNSSDNAALSNSTFEVKRNHIIRMDKEGKFIPHCTKMVFLKYYTPSDESQLHFWGKADRDAYVEEISRVLKYYMDGQRIIETEEND